MKLIICITLFMTFNARASNFMLVMGGGGEGPGASTIFDTEIGRLGKNLENSTWSYDILFDGGHSNSDAMIKSSYKKAKSTGEFSEASFKKMLTTYENRILSGEIKSSDQLVIVIDSHSSPNRPKLKQASHSIAINNTSGKKLAAEEFHMDTVNLDALTHLIDLADSKNIKLGIVDLGCFSGNALALQKKNTCIISSTGKMNFSYHDEDSFSRKLIDQFNRGNTLENAFLQARAQSHDPSSPAINTSQGQLLTEQIYPLIQKYMNSNDEHYHTLGDSIVRASNDNKLLCQREQQFTELILKIQHYEALIPNSTLKNLVAALKAYKLHQDEMLKKIAKIRLLSDQMETFDYHFPALPGGKEAVGHESYSWGQLDQMDFKKLKKGIEADPTQKSLLDFYNRVEARKEEILKSHPQVIGSYGRIFSIAAEVDKTYKLAKNVMLEEKKLYNQLYDRKPAKKEKHPCSQIVF